MAERLLSPEMFSGWGVRTLATSMAGYNPVSYHNGSVWPHDNAIVAAGSHALRLRRGGPPGHRRRMLDAAPRSAGRLPELFAGSTATEFPCAGELPDVVLAPGVGGGGAAAVPAHPAALRPVDPARQAVARARCCPEGIERLRVERIPLLGGRITVEVDRTTK